MMKPILYILILFPLLGLSQNHVGKYFGTVENDTIGKIDITFELNQDSTYEITAQFDYYGINEGHCFDGQHGNISEHGCGTRNISFLNLAQRIMNQLQTVWVNAPIVVNFLIVISIFGKHSEH